MPTEVMKIKTRPNVLHWDWNVSFSENGIDSYMLTKKPRKNSKLQYMTINMVNNVTGTSHSYYLVNHHAIRDITVTIKSLQFIPAPESRPRSSHKEKSTT